MSQDFNDPNNPYSAPQNPYEQQWQPGRQQPGRCPNCGSPDSRVPSFTWWGGAVGHRILSHVICNHCNKGFNSKTGGSNTTGIVIYSVVVALVLFIIFFVLFSRIR